MKYWIRKYREWINRLQKKTLKRFWVTSGIFLLFAIFDIETLKGVELGNIAGIARTIENIAPRLLRFFTYKSIKILICSAFLILSGLLLSKIYLRPKAKIIKHSTFSNTQSSYDESTLHEYAIKEVDVNLIDSMARGAISIAVRDQDAIIKEILKTSDEYTEICYYGIAHIPLIFRAGFQIGDEGQTRLFHKYRNATPLFKEVSVDQENYAIHLRPSIRDRRYTSNSHEMLVVIATSLQIQDADLLAFYQKDLCCELYFKPEDESSYGFDNIASYPTMKRLKDSVLKEIRKQAIEYNVQRIHLILSTSSDFTFYLAEGFSEHHDPEIIVYQYERTSTEKYPWGISNKAAPENAVIYNTAAALKH